MSLKVITADETGLIKAVNLNNNSIRVWGKPQNRRNGVISMCFSGKSASKREESMDHTLLVGPPGLGKTTLAQIIANELGVGFRSTSGPVISKSGDLAAILNKTQSGVIVNFDDIDNLKVNIQKLYEQYKNNTLTTQSVNISSYHRKKLTEQLANIIKQTVKS